MVYERGADPSDELLSELLKESAHLTVVDFATVPAHAVASGETLPVLHATDETQPVGDGGAVGFGKLNDRLSGVVEELIVLDPEGGVPGFVVGPTVVGSGAHRVSFELKSV